MIYYIIQSLVMLLVIKLKISMLNYRSLFVSNLRCFVLVHVIDRCHIFSWRVYKCTRYWWQADNSNNVSLSDHYVIHYVMCCVGFTWCWRIVTVQNLLHGQITLTNIIRKEAIRINKICNAVITLRWTGTKRAWK